MPQAKIDSETRSVFFDSPTSPPTFKRPGLPLVAIAGASGKTSTGWILAHMYERAGFEVAAWLTGGVYVDQKFRQDELHAWEFATLAARAREIDVLIQEVPAVLAGNLAPGSIETAIFTSICGNDDHCKRDAGVERERFAVESVAAAVRGSGRLIVNADDLIIVDNILNQRPDTVFYALNHANPALQNHINSGGNGCWVEDGWIVAQASGNRHYICKVRELPSSLDGHLLFQVQNALAATASALPLIRYGIDLGPLLKSVDANDPRRRGGPRELKAPAGRLIVDAPKSLIAIKQIARAVRSFGARRVVLVLDDFEDFIDDDLFEAARVLGSIAGIAILIGAESSSRRMETLKSGLMRSTTPPAIIHRDRMDDAVAYARTLIKDDDVALILTGEPGSQHGSNGHKAVATQSDR